MSAQVMKIKLIFIKIWLIIARATPQIVGFCNFLDTNLSFPLA